MSNKKYSHIRGMGVINRTPNSFSDAGYNLQKENFYNSLNEWLVRPSMIIDVGFESTAPMNKAISDEEEWERFLAFFELIKDVNLDDRILSLDTYKIKNALGMIECLKKSHPKLSLVLNDVSGVLDDDLMDLLTSKHAENIGYIYNFTFIPNRNEVLNHMQYINEEGDILKKCLASFKHTAHEFYKNKISADLFLDPGFGFSKTFLQNMKIISEFDLFTRELFLQRIRNPLIIGLSKKSFMKRFLQVETGEETEEFHRQTILKMSRISHSQLIFRVHNPKILDT